MTLGPPTVTLHGQSYPYRVRRSRKARHVLLHVDLQGIELVVPQRVSVRLAQHFVHSRVAWLERAVARHQQLQARVPTRSFQTGEQLPLLNRTWSLVVTYHPGQRRTSLKTEGQVIKITAGSVAQCRAALVTWYRRQAQTYFSEVATALAQQLDVRVTKVAIRQPKTQWGSASRRGTLSFNWRLLLAPEAVVRYVAAHEVAHLRHPNHSAAFWQTVARLEPEYHIARTWLKHNGYTLIL